VELLLEVVVIHLRELVVEVDVEAVLRVILREYVRVADSCGIRV
jgi:hypothetical protein